jgi:tRNA threonylcarbamoyladenosine biosynthesis protein TsaB
MNYILHIDTSSRQAHVSLAADGKIVEAAVNDLPQDHASFLHPAIEKIIRNAGITLNNLSAVAVVSGPGSYTGLRVGMATAKGICYALNKPLITLNALDVMAAAAIAENKFTETTTLFFPMIDARRMEVFTAGYNQQHECISSYSAMVLTENSFAELLTQTTVVFFGSGAGKWQKVCSHPNAMFTSSTIPASIYSRLSMKAYTNKQFANLAYAAPFYLKEVHITAENNI